MAGPISKEVREAIQGSHMSLRALASQHGINVKTVAKWRSRSSPEDIPSIPRKMKSGKLSADDDYTIFLLACTKNLSLDQYLKELKGDIPQLTRSSLYRSLVRQGLYGARGNRKEPAAGPRNADRQANADFSHEVSSCFTSDSITREPIRQNEIKRDIALSIAGRYFLKYGYERTSMTAIADELGGSKSTLWKIFPSKSELFLAFMRSASDWFHDDFAKSLYEGERLDISIKRFVHKLLTYLYSPPSLQLYRLILGGRSHFGEEGWAILIEMYTRNFRKIVEFIDIYIKKGQLKSGDPEDVAYVLESLCNGGHYHRALINTQSPDAFFIAQEADRITHRFLLLYASEPPQRL